jgi:hypothetical protein
MPLRAHGHQTATVVAIVTGTGLLLVGFFASPLILLLIDRAFDADWTRLANIGQTYGAASALLAGLAVGGVAASLAMQVRQVRISQIQAARMMHVELMQMLTADPVLRSTSPAAIGVSEDQWRRSIYTNLFFKYLEMGFLIGHISEESLRQHFAVQFRLEHVREFWRHTRETFRTDADRGGPRRFFQIVDEQYQHSLDADESLWTVTPPANVPTLPIVQNPQTTVVREALSLALGLLVGSAISGVVAKSRRRHWHKS